MKEYSFRITRKQLTALGGLLAAKTTENVVVGECGHGWAKFNKDLIRESWSYNGKNETIGFDNVRSYEFKEEKWYCVFSTSIDHLDHIAFANPTCLWAVFENNQLTVYRFEDHLSMVDTCLIVDHSLSYSFRDCRFVDASEMYERTVQAFGSGTTEYLSHLTIGVVGVSGTGSIVAEQLYRLGIKRLVLVDDDYVEVRNLGRIINSTLIDARSHKNKAEMLKCAYDSIHLGPEVIAVPTVIAKPDAIHLLSQCDFIFGCLDSADGRLCLNRLCTFYTLPYIDLGVKLKSDHGRITEISGAIRYVLPDGASLLSMQAYTTEQATSEALRRTDPEAYRARLKEKYIEGAQESSPAVISVNMLIGSLAVLELLNRIHNYRDIPNEGVEILSVNLLEPCFPSPTAPGLEDIQLSKYLGKGDTVPLLDMPWVEM